MLDISELFYRLRTLPLVPRIIAFSLIGLVIFGIFFWSLSDIFFPPSARQPAEHPGAGAGTAAPAIASATQVSPLLFGTNLGLFDDHDRVLTSATTRGMLQQLHMKIIRMPVRTVLKETTEIQAAQTIKNLGAAPVVILLVGTDDTTLASDKQVVTDLNKIFGSSVVYYEYGSEQDLAGLTASGYTSAWNAVIPQLKQLAPHAHFVGPATYHYDQAYLTTFLQGAQPRPDEISWHEYACVGSDTKDTCLANIAHWSEHITSARTAMTGSIGQVLPIMITEWNYSADAVSTATPSMDDKSQDSQFLKRWAQQAMQTLANNHVFASMQYFCTSSVPIVANDDTIAPQGQAVQDLYNQFLAGNKFASPSVAMQATTGPQTQPTATADTQPTATDPTQPQPTATDPTQPQPTATTVAQPQPTAVPTTVVMPTATTAPVPHITPTAIPGVNPQDLYTIVTNVPPAYASALAHQDSASWDTGPFNGSGGCNFTGGAYQIDVSQKSLAGVCLANGATIGDFAFQVQMTILKGDGGGITFRDANQQLYRFHIGLDGTYSLENMARVLTAGSSAAIKTGANQTNELTVIARGQQIFLYVNKQFLANVTDSTSSTGKLGLFAVDLANPTTITFSHVQIWSL